MEKLQAVQTALETNDLVKGDFRNYYFTSAYNNRRLNGCFKYEFNEFNGINTEYLARVKNSLAELDTKAHAHIQCKFPDKNAGELELADLIFYPDQTFALGYYTGRAPMGETFMYVVFQPDFTPNEKLVYEFY